MNKQNENLLQEFYRLQKVEAELKKIEELDDLDAFKGKWRNVSISKSSGKIYLGTKLFDSREKAEEWAKAVSERKYILLIIFLCGSVLLKSDVQYLYAEPVLE